MYFDREGLPISRRQCKKLLKEPGYKIVKQTQLTNDKFVSTVWIGLDHSFSDDELPIIFEVAVFSTSKKGNMEYMERHRSEHQALEAHEFICECYAKL